MYQNVSELVRLQTAVAEGLKRFEFALRRKVEGDANKAALSSADNVPHRVPSARRAVPTALSAGHRGDPPDRARGRAGPRTGHGPRPRSSASTASARGPRPPRLPKEDSFGRGFTFCRGIYRSVRGEAGGQGWSTDYPDAELNFSIRLSELTKTRVTEGYRRQARLPDRSASPTRRSSSARTSTWKTWGPLQFTDEEVEVMRAYLMKGGFVWVDDFWGSYAWENWTRELGRVLPPSEYPIEDVPLDHPIFKSQLIVQHFPQIPSIQYWRRDPHETSERGADSAEAHSARDFRQARSRDGVHVAQHGHLRCLGTRGRGSALLLPVLPRTATRWASMWCSTR